jgi:hypothetical protein
VPVSILMLLGVGHGLVRARTRLLLLAGHPPATGGRRPQRHLGRPAGRLPPPGLWFD